MAALGEDLETHSTCCFEELPSLSPGKSFVKEVPSVFIIPGLQGAPADMLKLLAKQIMFPVLCAKLPSNSCSLSETASLLAKVNCTYAVESLLYTDSVSQFLKIIKINFYQKFYNHFETRHHC